MFLSSVSLKFVQISEMFWESCHRSGVTGQAILAVKQLTLGDLEAGARDDGVGGESASGPLSICEYHIKE